MITEEKLEIYRKHHGDIDSWARTSGQDVQAAMTGADWYLIESLIQDIKLAGKGHASTSYRSDAQPRVMKHESKPIKYVAETQYHSI